jgi:uncharacterized membrane protein
VIAGLLMLMLVADHVCYDQKRLGMLEQAVRISKHMFCRVRLWGERAASTSSHGHRLADI